IGGRATATESFPISISAAAYGPALKMSKEGDLYLFSRGPSDSIGTTTGIVLTSPDGKSWRITVSDSGDLVAKEHK
ncbi:hypothetical protein, partial [Candidatus Ornithobacterium hominis]|uniref:hypothetical protein n=1 Tax=Candidatus Ornithobacterium hominis TaxID=2497989 RepID=UPI0014034E59